MSKFKEIAALDLQVGASKVVYSPNGARIAVAKDDQTIEIRDGETGELIEAFATQSAITSLSFDADSERLLFGRARRRSGHPVTCVAGIHRGTRRSRSSFGVRRRELCHLWRRRRHR